MFGHKPVLISEANGTRYAICKNCESNIESWYFDGDEDRLGSWTSFGVFVTLDSKGAGYLDKSCHTPANSAMEEMLVTA